MDNIRWDVVCTLLSGYLCSGLNYQMNISLQGLSSSLRRPRRFITKMETKRLTSQVIDYGLQALKKYQHEHFIVL